jgi:DNA polymerase (family 10)
MPTVNAAVVAAFLEIAELLEIEGANPFRIRAYRNAARMLDALGRDVRTLADQPAALDALPGIGPDLAGKITEIVHTGSCPLLDRLRTELPSGITQLLKIPGLGPRRVRLLHQELGIETPEQLHQAAEQGRIRALHGFGRVSEQRLLVAVTGLLRKDVRYRRDALEPVAQALVADLRAMPGVHQAFAVGSLRRGSETVGDIDVLVSADKPGRIMDKLSTGKDVQRILEKGITRCSLLHSSGVQIDVRAVAPASLGAAALYFTGSKAHNIALRKLAQSQGLKLNEYGLYRGRQRIAGDSEASVFAALGLAKIAPELREDRGELAAAASGALPELLQLTDLQGDLHVHTTDSDGLDGLQAMVAAARARGLHYLAITDHASRMAVPQGLDADGLLRQVERIDALNAQLTNFRLLKGVEVDIAEDGSLDLPDAVLRQLDLVVGAVHRGFGLSRGQQTERLLRAMDSPCFSLLAHPTGRLINERPGYEIDLARVLRKARERGCFVELNAQPARLDLNDIACRMAKDEGMLVSINSDAHSAQQLDHLHFGVAQARRGWLAAGDVLNTSALPALLPLLKATMRG